MVLRRVGWFAFAGLAVLSCGGSSSTPTGSSTVPPTAAPTATPTAAPTSSPSGALACPYGKGDLSASCQPATSTYVADIDKAIGELAQLRPDIFNLQDEVAPGNYRVVKVADYFAGVVQRLQAAGFCAESDGIQHVQLKKSNAFSEKYAVLTSTGYVRRGDRSYRDSCFPAIFPVEDAEYIDAVRVHFFSIRCPEGRTAPDNAEKKLPIGCTGYVSATPKDRNNRDVPPAIHGKDIYWEILQGEGENLARVTDFPEQPFNKVVDPLNEGYLTLCATVKRVRGCFGFDVIR
jgi:hypothetical protein